MKKIIITESQLEHIKKSEEKKSPNKDIFLLLANIGKAYNGDKYVDIEQFKTNGILDPSKYTPEMLKKFKKICKPEGKDAAYCKNSDWDRCYLKCDSCFHDIFNPSPSGAFAKIHNFMNDTDWKYNTPEDITKIFIENKE